MNALPARPLRDTGPIELRDFGPTGRRLGTVADCYDGSPWELHRGELQEEMRGEGTHSIVMPMVAALFGTHARPGMSVMMDVYCDLSSPTAASVRTADVVLVGDLAKPKNANYTGTPILAVEVRGTQSKRYLEEKVKLYLEHDWPCTWIVHVAKQQVEVLRPGSAPVVYPVAASVPLPPELDKHGLAALPVAALFDEAQGSRFSDGWVKTNERAQAVLTVLATRGLVVPDGVRARVLASRDPEALARWLALAVTAPSEEAFAAGMG